MNIGYTKIAPKKNFKSNIGYMKYGEFGILGKYSPIEIPKIYLHSPYAVEA